jgi:stage V sporulation protein SpoVS
MSKLIQLIEKTEDEFDFMYKYENDGFKYTIFVPKKPNSFIRTIPKCTEESLKKEQEKWKNEYEKRTRIEGLFKKQEKIVINVSRQINTTKLAGTIVHLIRSGEEVEMHSLGAEAVNIMVKAFISAKGNLNSYGYEIVQELFFLTKEIQEQEMNLIGMKIKV